MHSLSIAAIGLFLTACATHAVDIEANYTPLNKFAGYDCDQLGQVAQDTSLRAQELARKQDKRRRHDNAMMTVGLIVFWPSLLFVKGDGAEANELANLKGDMIAIEKASGDRRCAIQFDKGKED
jgi:hypothetical protein